jgi:hypothetical protein
MQDNPSKTSRSLPLRTIAVMTVFLSLVTVAIAAFKEDKKKLGEHISLGDEPNVVNKDSIESVTAFMDVYSVLMSPRCMNCHPAGDVPLQGDDSHLHTMLPKRGKDGKGLFAMKCTNCHQPDNTIGLHTPPGSPNWHLPPSNMKMVFQGKTANELAKQLVDPKQNGNKTIKQLLEHAHDKLVIAGWNPGEGRTLPPLSHAQFTKAWYTWIKKGAYAPAP